MQNAELVHEIKKSSRMRWWHNKIRWKRLEKLRHKNQGQRISIVRMEISKNKKMLIKYLIPSTEKILKWFQWMQKKEPQTMRENNRSARWRKIFLNVCLRSREPKKQMCSKIKYTRIPLKWRDSWIHRFKEYRYNIFWENLIQNADSKS